MELLTATSEICDGSMGVMPGVSETEALANKERFCRKIGVDPGRLVRGEQTHSANVAAVREIPNGKIPDTDALVTDVPGIFLGVITADCVPVFLWNESARAVGIAHAGWKGIVGGVVPATVRSLAGNYNIRPENISARIGPAIRACHYEIGKERLGELAGFEKLIQKRDGKLFFDLVSAVVDQLETEGVRKESVNDCGECTYCLKNKFFSYRRDRNEEFPRGKGNMLSVIGYRA
jgi:YfiH family protein